MTQSNWVILCDNTYHDDRGKVCIDGIFDTLTAAAVPALHPRLAVVAEIEGEPNQRADARLTFSSPDGQIVFEHTQNFVLPWNGVMRLMWRLSDVPIPGYGIHSFCVYEGDSLLRVCPMRVTEPQADPG